MLLQPALGWLSDRYGRTCMQILCGGGAMFSAIALPFAISTPWMFWPLLVALGACAGGIYMLALVANGERFRGPMLIAASAVMNATWGVAGIVGPLFTGAAMEGFGPDALPTALAIAAALFLLSLRSEQPRGATTNTIRM